jgi:hypothetical protein
MLKRYVASQETRENISGMYDNKVLQAGRCRRLLPFANTSLPHGNVQWGNMLCEEVTFRKSDSPKLQQSLQFLVVGSYYMRLLITFYSDPECLRRLNTLTRAMTSQQLPNASYSP